jgi:Leucine-rich repeat (LRR) protein
MSNIIHISARNRQEYEQGEFPDITVISYEDYFYRESLLINSLSRFPNLQNLSLFCESFPRTIVIKLCNFKTLRHLERLRMSYFHIDFNDIDDLTVFPLKSLSLFNCFEDYQADDWKKIINLEFLKHFPKLTVLEINKARIIPPEGEIYQCQPFQYLSCLESITLNNCRLETIWGFDNCPSLRYVEIANNQVDDISYLSKCPLLSCVDIRNNKISDMRCLSECHLLKKIRCDDNPIKTLNGLEFCQNLEHIGIPVSLPTTFPLELISTLQMIIVVTKPAQKIPKHIRNELAKLSRKGIEIVYEH